MSLIQIGKTTEGKPVNLDLPTLLRTHLQIQGASGSGKSWLVRLLAEQLFGKVPVIIVDQEGEYATLREKYDYLLVGKGGETPTAVQSAGLLSQRLLELRASAVIDLYDLDIPARKTWIRKFFEGIMSVPKEYWRPTVFIIDEAHDFIPEKSESECASILASAISKGRKRGFAFVCATQRLSKLNKDVASELQNVLIGKTWLDIDRERGASALGIYSKSDKEHFFDEVKRLPQGSFYAQGAALSLDRILLQTGAVQTTHPDSSNVKNKKTWLVPPPAPKAVQAMLEKLGDLPKEAAEEIATVSELKRKNAELLRELKVLEKRSVQQTSDPKLASHVSDLQALLKNQTASIDALQEHIKSLRRLLDRKGKLVAQAAEILSEDTKLVIPAAPEVKNAKNLSTGVGSRKPNVLAKVPVPVSKAPAVHKVPQNTQAGVDAGLNNKQLDILRALAQFRALGRQSVPRTWVAHLSGASHRSSAYANNVSNLRSRGLIEYTLDGITLTPAGEEIAPYVETPLTTMEMVSSVQRMLTNPQQAIMKHLVDIFPESADREATAEAAGASVLSSAFANNVSALKSAGIITYQPDRTLRAADWLFLEGEAD